MKLFEVVFEMEDRSKDAKPGALINEHRWYVAETAELVWEKISTDRQDQSRRFMTLREALPMVLILGSNP